MKTEHEYQSSLGAFTIAVNSTPLMESLLQALWRLSCQPTLSSTFSLVRINLLAAYYHLL